MNRIAIAAGLALLILLLATRSASADHIGIYSDAQSSSACMYVTPGVPVTTYVIHKFTMGTTASRWKIENNSPMFNLGWSANGIYLGDPYSDFTASYDECVTDEVLILSLTQMWLGQTMVCGRMRVAPANGMSWVLKVDCASQEAPASGGEFFFNPGPECEWYCYDPVGTSTWGRVKALYR